MTVRPCNTTGVYVHYIQKERIKYKLLMEHVPFLFKNSFYPYAYSIPSRVYFPFILLLLLSSESHRIIIVSVVISHGYLDWSHAISLDCTDNAA